ncbi:MAG: porin [Deltaproteobacteria bacterium]|nr:porin [Deltaproteobacteria bacterium]MBW2069858.1 porin [Deltaproteobacteria bacterium]
MVEEILDVLRSQGQISEEQYHELLQKAQAEEAKRGETRQGKEIGKQEPHATKGEETAAAKKTKVAIPMYGYWKNGLAFESADRKFTAKIGGRINVDAGEVDTDHDVKKFFDNQFGSGVNFRRARLSFEATIYHDIMLKSEYDFTSGETKFKDVYVGMRGLPYVGTLRIGHQKEPFSLEEIISGNYVTFMERALPNGFVPDRNTGLGLNNTVLDRRMTWAVGGFRETDNQGSGLGNPENYNVTARVTGLPWYRDKGSRLLHLGLSYSHKFVDKGGTVRFRSRPETQLTSERFVDTGSILADDVDLLAPAAAVVFGPLSFQGEYIYSHVDPKQGSSLDFDGYYIYGSYFLTGEHRSYSTSHGAFSRIRPKKNFQLHGGGWGAWEVALRYSHMDLDDEDVEGGKLSDITAGLNWYLNPSVRIMFNYIHADLDHVGDTNIYQSRFQINL